MTGRPRRDGCDAGRWGDGSTIDPAMSLRAALTFRAARSCTPLSVEVELTARCNLRCVHCYVGQRRHAARPELSLERLLYLVSEVHAAGCMFFTVTGGEVAMRDGWLRVIEAARRQRMVVTVLTNGSLIGTDEARALAGLRVKEVAVSVYGDSAPVHDRITGVAGSFERTVGGIRALRQADVPVRVACVVMEANVDRVAKVRELAERLGCTYRFDPTVRPGADGSLEPLRHRVSAERVAKAVYQDETIGPQTVERKAEAIRRRPLPAMARNSCVAGFAACFIDAAGDVFACPGFPPSFGNLAHSSFADVWQGPLAEEHRHRMLEPLRVCSDCELLRFCLSRCPRLALVEDGSVNGPSSRACEMARMVKELCGDGASDEGGVALGCCR